MVSKMCENGAWKKHGLYLEGVLENSGRSLDGDFFNRISSYDQKFVTTVFHGQKILGPQRNFINKSCGPKVFRPMILSTRDSLDQKSLLTKRFCEPTEPRFFFDKNTYGSKISD